MRSMHLFKQKEMLSLVIHLGHKGGDIAKKYITRVCKKVINLDCAA